MFTHFLLEEGFREEQSCFIKLFFPAYFIECQDLSRKGQE
jgi:hypothetical protein